MCRRLTRRRSAPVLFTRPVQVLMDKGVASSGETMVLLAARRDLVKPTP